MIRTRTFSIAVLLTTVTLPGSAQERDRSKIAEKYKWNLADLYPSDDAWRAAKDKLPPEIPKVAAFKGTLGTSAARLADALDAANAVGKELQKVFVYAEPDLRPGHARRQVPGHAAGDAAGRRGVRRGSVVHRAGDPEDRQGDARQVDRAGAAAQDLPRTTSTTSSGAAPHTLSDAEEKLLAGARSVAAHRIVGLQHLLQRRLPVSRRSRSATARRVKLDSAGVQPLSRRAQSRRSQEGDGGLLQRARQLHGDVRLDAERPGAVERVLRQRAPLRDRARRGARRAEHPDLGLHAPRRRREPGPADVPSLPAAAQEDDGAARPALLRSLRAARRVGRSELHARGGAEARPRRAGAARPGLRRARSSARSTSAGSICCRPRASGRARTRTAAPTTCTRTC